jgi:SAM-dependent methyltransferase
MIQRLACLSRYVSYAHHMIRRHVSDFAATVGQRRCIVDVGSGAFEPYKDLFDSVDGIYVSMDRFERASLQGDAKAIPVASGRADLVLCTEVLEHLPDPHRALAEMYRVLTPAGFLVLTVPLVWGEHHGMDYYRWTEAGLRRMLQRVGFEVQVVKRRGGIFSTLGCLVTRTPCQVFGQLEDQRCWLVRTIYILCWLLTIPVPWFLALFDSFDRTKAFTVGYSALCRKRPGENDGARRDQALGTL